MKVNKLYDDFVGEIVGADLSREPDQAIIDLLEASMKENVVTCIRDQGHISDEEHLRFSRAFGPLELPGTFDPDAPRRIAYGLYDASNLDLNGDIVDPTSPRAKFSKGNELFHADSSFNDMPSKWSMLRGVIVPPERGDTQFVDMRKVYEALPQAMKDRIETLVAEHSFAASRIKGGVDRSEEARIKAVIPGARHPLVRVSPSGRKSLFVGSHAYRIDGMDDDEATALLAELLAFASQEHFVYSHKWRQGDMLVWDNRCAVHRGTEFDYENHKRDLRRTNVNEYGEERSATAGPLPTPEAERRKTA